MLVALFLAPAAFAVQLLAAYVIASRTCSQGGSPQVLLLLIHAAAALAAGIGFGFALASWRRTRNEKPGDAGEAIDRGDGRTRFLALCGLYGSVVFLIAVLVDASAVVFLGICPGLPGPS
ncbi:MAG TPA: hypothetical protein VL251_09880 [Thermomonas sp.]|nr:hypothetical protein [Thermomonas sp.]